MGCWVGEGCVGWGRGLDFERWHFGFLGVLLGGLFLLREREEREAEGMVGMI